MLTFYSTWYLAGGAIYLCTSWWFKYIHHIALYALMHNLPKQVFLSHSHAQLKMQWYLVHWWSFILHVCNLQNVCLSECPQSVVFYEIMTKMLHNASQLSCKYCVCFASFSVSHLFDSTHTLMITLLNAESFVPLMECKWNINEEFG